MKKIIAIALSVCIVGVMMSGCRLFPSREVDYGDLSSGVAEYRTKAESEIENELKDEQQYEKGIMTETGFESEFVGVKFAIPEGFVMATEEEISKFMDIGADALGVDGKIVDYAKLSTVYEMVASAPPGKPNVSVIVEKLSLSNMTEEQYMTAAKTQMLALTNADYELVDESEEEIAGQTYKKLIFNVDLAGMKLMQNYLARKVNDRMVVFTVTYTAETKDEIETLMKSFTKY